MHSHNRRILITISLLGLHSFLNIFGSAIDHFGIKSQGFSVKGPWKVVSLPFYNYQVNDLASISPIYSADAPLKSPLLSKLPILFEAELATNDPVNTHILMKGWEKECYL